MHTTSRSPTITYTSKVTVGNLLRHFSAPTTTRLKIVVSQFESGSRHLTKGLESSHFWIAVGTAVAGGPPRRSQRALLAHWAPPSGVGVESRFGIWMLHAGGW